MVILLTLFILPPVSFFLCFVSFMNIDHNRIRIFQIFVGTAIIFSTAVYFVTVLQSISKTFVDTYWFIFNYNKMILLIANLIYYDILLIIYFDIIDWDKLTWFLMVCVIRSHQVSVSGIYTRMASQLLYLLFVETSNWTNYLFCTKNMYIYGFCWMRSMVTSF